MIISIDFETRAVIDLRQVGVYRYVEDPHTDVWCMAYKIDDQPVELWRAGDPFPFQGINAPYDQVRFSAWNAGFERAIWNGIMVPKYSWPEAPLSMWDDTAAAAAYLALPRSLEKCAEVLLGEEYQKDTAGSRLCLQMAKPRRMEGDQPVWWNKRNKLDALYAYCRQDVVVESEIRRKVWAAFTPEEMEVWRLDQRMNDRGVLVDTISAQAARELADQVEAEISNDLSLVTGGEVDAVTNARALLSWVKSKGVMTDTVKREWVEANLKNPKIPECVRDALELRYAGGKSSVAKLDKFIKVASSVDGRARGLLFYYGADTGRWAGRLIQPQNLPRGEVKFDPDEPLLWNLLKEGNAELVDTLYAPVLTTISSALRGLFRAPPGYDLIGSDYASIEARVLAWLAGEERALEIFRGHGLVYENFASQVFSIPMKEVTKEQRAHGKVGVLGCGYQMGWKTLQEHAKGYDLRLTEEEAKTIVYGFRDLHPNIVGFWEELNWAAIKAVMNPGERFYAGEHISFIVKGWFLRMQLPSGRELFYASPKLTSRPLPWDREERQVGVQIWHVNSYTRQWSPRFLYGGLLAENATQATARDVMVDGMFALEESGVYLPVLTVHDEIVMEVPTEQGSIHEVETLMSETPPWAPGLPVAAEAWRGNRYRKD